MCLGHACLDKYIRFILGNFFEENKNSKLANQSYLSVLQGSTFELQNEWLFFGKEAFHQKTTLRKNKHELGSIILISNVTTKY